MIPAPLKKVEPLVMVIPERVTCAVALEIWTTGPMLPLPSRIVVFAPEPRIFRLMPMVKRSL